MTSIAPLLREQALNSYRAYIETYLHEKRSRGWLIRSAEEYLVGSVMLVCEEVPSRQELLDSFFHLIELAEASYPTAKYPLPPRPHGL